MEKIEKEIIKYFSNGKLETHNWLFDRNKITEKVLLNAPINRELLCNAPKESFTDKVMQRIKEFDESYLIFTPGELYKPEYKDVLIKIISHMTSINALFKYLECVNKEFVDQTIIDALCENDNSRVVIELFPEFAPTSFVIRFLSKHDYHKVIDVSIAKRDDIIDYVKKNPIFIPNLPIVCITDELKKIYFKYAKQEQDFIITNNQYDMISLCTHEEIIDLFKHNLISKNILTCMIKDKPDNFNEYVNLFVKYKYGFEPDDVRYNKINCDKINIEIFAFNKWTSLYK